MERCQVQIRPERPYWCLFSLLLMHSYIALASARNLNPIAVTTTYGEVMGVRFETYDAFLGVPYARPPIGDLRWRDPLPPASWYPELLVADTQPPGCIQDCMDPGFACPREISEDCLYLDIYRPKSQSEELLPVYVFLHGGEFHSGGCSATLYSGKYLAPAVDAIVVCVNYRLGALGFLYLGADPLTGEEIAGNFGLRDQLAALRFLKGNLRYFGGNPDKVTLAGQSAGAESISIHMTSPEADDLFQKVVLYSDPLALPLLKPHESALLGEHFASVLSCENDTLRCLRSKSADDIRIASTTSESFLPNDSKIFQAFQLWGPVVRIEPVESFEAGLYRERPIMMGTTSEESRQFVFTLFERPVPDFLYAVSLGIIIPDYSQEVLVAYPVDPDVSDQREVISRIGTDYVFTCPNLHVAKLMYLQHGVDVYHYISDQAFSTPMAWGEYTECYEHACHGGDLPYILGTAEKSYGYSTDEREMMEGQWEFLSNFIRTGDPNSRRSGYFPYWPSIGEERGVWSTLVLSADDGIRVDTNWKEDRCRFWDSIGYHDVPNMN